GLRRGRFRSTKLVHQDFLHQSNQSLRHEVYRRLQPQDQWSSTGRSKLAAVGTWTGDRHSRHLWRYWSFLAGSNFPSAKLGWEWRCSFRPRYKYMVSCDEPRCLLVRARLDGKWQVCQCLGLGGWPGFTWDGGAQSRQSDERLAISVRRATHGRFK